ncbi:MAG: FlgD immunoglobulin-like domain containing protein [Candidatus Eisenbacteria bacterium]
MALAVLVASPRPALPHDDLLVLLDHLDSLATAQPFDVTLHLRHSEFSRLAGDTATARRDLALVEAISPRSLNVLGSLVLDIRGSELDAVFLDDLGAVRDSFAIVKGPVSAGEPARPGFQLALAGANPTRGTTALGVELPRAGRARLSIVDASGRLVRRVFAGARPAGRTGETWHGKGEARRPVAPGVYFAVLEFECARRVARVVRL